MTTAVSFQSPGERQRSRPAVSQAVAIEPASQQLALLSNAIGAQHVSESLTARQVTQQPIPLTQPTPSHLSQSSSESAAPSFVQTRDKTHAAGTGFFSRLGRGIGWVASSAVEGVAWCGMKAVEMLAISSSSIRRSREESIERLKTLTGDLHLGQMVLHVSSTLSRLIPEVFGEGLLHRLAAGEEPMINEMFQTMLLKMTANIAESVRRERSAADQPAAPITAIDILAHLTHTINKKLQEVQTEMAAAEAVEDPVQKQLALARAIEPVADALLSLAYPQGSSELPFRPIAAGLVWSQLKSRAIIPGLIEFARSSQVLPRLAAGEGAEGERAFPYRAAREVGQLMTHWGSTLVTDAQVATGMANRAVQALNISVSTAEGAAQRNWLVSQIGIIGRGDQPAARELWRFLGSGIETIFAYVLRNASRGRRANEDEEIAILRNVSRTVREFVDREREGIARLHAQLKAQGKQPESEAEYIAKFVPLAQQLQILIGLGEEGPFSGMMRRLVNSAFGEQIPVQLAAIYQTYLLPLSEADNLMSDPVASTTRRLKMTVGGATAAAQCDRGAQMVAQQVVRAVGESRTVIAHSSAEAVAEGLISVKTELKQKILTALGISTVPSFPEASAGEGRILARMKNLIEEWVSNRLTHLTSSGNPQAAALSEFIHCLLSDRFADMILKGPDEQPSHLSAIIGDRALAVVNQFLAENRSAIYSRYQMLKDAGTAPESDPQFVAYFEQLCQRMLNAFNFDESASHAGIVVLLRKMVLANLPKQLAKQYRDCLSPQECLSTYRTRLKASLNIQDDTQANRAVEQIENLSELLADKISATLERSGMERIATLFGEPLPALEGRALTEWRQSYLKEMIKSLFMQGLVHYLEQSGAPRDRESLFSVIISKLAYTIKPYLDRDGDTIQRAAALTDPRERTLALRRALTPLARELLSLFKSPSAPAGQRMPFIVPFASMIGDRAWNQLGEEFLPDFLAQMILDTTSWERQIARTRTDLTTRSGTTYIPEACRVLAQWVSEFMPPALTRDRAQLVQGIFDGISAHLRQSGNPRGISVADYLRENETLIKQKLCEDFLGFFGEQSQLIPYGQPHVKQYVEAALLRLCDGLTRRIDARENPAQQTHQKDFLLKMGLRMLTIFNHHFSALNRATEAAGRSMPSDVPHERLIAEFGSELHSAVPRAAEALAARRTIKQQLHILKHERKRLQRLTKPAQIRECKANIRNAQAALRRAKEVENVERQKFFLPFTKQFLELCGVTSAQDLPFPSPIREQLWEKLEKELLPTMFNNLYDTILNPTSRLKMAISGLRNMNETLDQPVTELLRLEVAATEANQPLERFLKSKVSGNYTQQQIARAIERGICLVNGRVQRNASIQLNRGDYVIFDLTQIEEVHEDETQRELNEACGELILQLAQTVPKSILKTMFRIDTLQTLTAGMIGRSVRRQLGSNWTLLRMIEQGIENGIPNINPGGLWRGNGPERVFYGTGPEGEARFTIPRTDDELEQMEMRNLEEAERLVSEAQSLTVSTIHKAVEQSVVAVLKWPIAWVNRKWDSAVDTVFGKYAGGVRRFFNYLGQRLIFRMIQVLLSMIGIPFKKTFWFFVDLHISYKVKQFYANLQLDIHESLLYKLSDELIASVRGDRPVDQNVLSTYVRAAQTRDRIQSQELEDYLRYWSIESSMRRNAS